jgi:hypothetical protein
VVNLQTDASNCNACGAACSTTNATPSCVGGQCTLTCAPGFGNCDNNVTNGCETPLTTLSNCGACGTACTTQNGTPTCNTATSPAACAVGSCSTGYASCPGNGTNCSTFVGGSDPKNCGACGNVCASDATNPNLHDSGACTGGSCTVGTCDIGWGDCNSNPTDGCETGLQTDPLNCGGCKAFCMIPANGTPGCAGGMCIIGSCNTGYADCDMQLGNGCEVNLQTDVNNCGACKNACVLPNATSACALSSCELVMCNAGFANCDMIASNGCEVNTTTDANNCNSCGNICPSGPHSTPVCNSSVCAIVCDPGYLDCDNNPANGCEVNANTDAANCSACGKACSMNHATESCVAGACTIVTCQSGFNDCNTDPSDGCEIDTQTSATNCGTCGTICATQNGTPACVNGMCAVGSCNTGFAHCPGMPGTNCETVTAIDVNNCGSCGNVCSNNNDTPVCANGVCMLNCNPGYGNCDGIPGNGCETPLGTVSNCGVCGTVCTTQNGTPTCNTAATPPVCAIGSCATGYAACPGNGNNCLTYIGGSDVNNCGACGHVCTTNNGTPVCVGGVCHAGSCQPGWGNCPGNGTDCSTPLTTVGNCGGCGVVCTTMNGTPACQNIGGLWTCVAQSCNPPWKNCPGNGTNCSTNSNTDNNNCGACGTVCNANTCGGAAQHVGSAACSGGVCDVTSCIGSWQDTNLTCSDGCECAISTVPTTCGAGAYSLGSVPVGGTPISHTSNLFPAAPNAAYYQVVFTGNTNTAFHPRITLTDPFNEFVMDVTTDCSVLESTMNVCNAAGDAPVAQAVSTWEASYTGPNPPADPAVYPVTGSHFQAIPAPGTGGTLYIKVYRTGGVITCNNAYTITVSG